MHFFNLKGYEFDYNKVSTYVQWFSLVAEGIVMNEDGSLMRTYQFMGRDLESTEPEEIKAVIAMVNGHLKQLGEGWCIYVEARRSKANLYKLRRFPDKACQMMDYERQNSFNHDTYYVNDYFITLQWLPQSERRKGIAKFFFDRNRYEEAADHSLRENLDSFLNTTKKVIDGFSKYLAWCRELDDEEMLTYLHSCVSLDNHVVKRPLEPVCLGDMLCDVPFYGGTNPVIGNEYYSEHLGCISIKSYPPESWACMLDELNRLDLEFRWVSRFICHEKLCSQEHVNSVKRSWKANDKDIITWLKEIVTKEESVMIDTTAVQRYQDADEVNVELSNDYISLGQFTSNVILRDSDREALKRKVLEVSRCYSSRGFTVSPETFNAVSAWFGSIPGNAYADPRRILLSSLNFCHLLPLSAVWSGEEYCKHLSEWHGSPVPALAQVSTAGSTPFFFNIHVGEVGHTMIVGPTGSGKSVLLNFIASQARGIPKSRIYVFDKGGSSRVFAAAVGGEFHDLASEAGEGGLSFQPLRYIDEENEKIWASEWLQGIFEQEGLAMTPERKRSIWDALTSLADTPPEDRTLTGLKIYLQSLALRDALEPFVIATKGITDNKGAYAGLFDSDVDTLAIESYQVFEMGGLMHKKSAVMPVLLYLFHVIEKNLTGEPTFIILDECWTFLDNPLFSEKIREWLKTMRKNNVSIIFATQNLEDIMRCSISSAIIESCYTKIFLPNPLAQSGANDEVYRAFDLSGRDREIIAGARPKFDYYLVSKDGRRIFELALSPYALSFIAASSREDQSECERIKREHPKDEFMAHWLAYKQLYKARTAYLELDK